MMRFSTSLCVAAVALSTAAIAQVGRSPAEQKIPAPANATGTVDDASPAKDADVMPADSTPAANQSAAGNAATAAPPAGEGDQPAEAPPK